MTVFWAKTPEYDEITWDTIHPVSLHCLDVGLTAEALVDGMWRSLSERIAHAWPDIKLGRRILAVLAALHDIGKISPGFQTKVPALTTSLKRSGFSFPADIIASDQGRNHSLQSFYFLRRHLRSMAQKISQEAIDALAQAVSCHHGRYFPVVHGPQPLPEWEAARIELFGELCRTWGFEERMIPLPVTEIDSTWTVLTAGFISVADWIGSSLNFPIVATDRDEYIQIRRVQIKDQLQKSGLNYTVSGARNASFHSLFGRYKNSGQSENEWRPNKTQSLVRSLVETASDPFLAIVQSPTGTGKTEAALWAYSQGVRTRFHGLYFALPTMATTNAMLSRLRSFLNQLFEEETQLRLVQSEARLNREFQELQRAGSNGGESDGIVRAYEWFNGRKRALLAEHGVGTVDQAMLAAMLAKHHFVRLAALHKKLIVIDEVHAYDVYMTSIISSLLSWLRGIGSSVVLLSATLSSTQNQELVRAYCGNDADVSMDMLTHSPSVTIASGDRVSSQSITDIQDRSAEIKLVVVDNSASSTFVTAIVDEVLRFADAGGCIACIVNTVDEAQQVYSVLQTRVPAETEITLLHSRFTRKDRAEKERVLIERFGPDSTIRPTRAIVVATQVIEQSLDVDFDVMVSDLAPVDLLIQRLGRVHRHITERPSGTRPHSKPALIVITPPITNEFRPRENVSYIYEPAVLARTAIALNNHGNQVLIPGDDHTLIENVYGEDPVALGTLSDDLEKWDDEMEGKHYADLFEADRVRLPPPEYVDADLDSLSLGILDLDEETFTTRLGSTSVTVVVISETAEMTVDALVDSTIRIGTPRIVRAVKEIETPVEWKDHWLLSRCVPLDLSRGPLRLGNTEVTYKLDEGLVVRSQEVE